MTNKTMVESHGPDLICVYGIMIRNNNDFIKLLKTLLSKRPESKAEMLNWNLPDNGRWSIDRLFL